MLYQLCEKLISIAETNDLNYEDKYAIIFSPKFSQLFYNILEELNIKFEYYDPDSTYDEDVLAFSNALKDNLERFRLISQHVKISNELENKVRELI